MDFFVVVMADELDVRADASEVAKAAVGVDDVLAAVVACTCVEEGVRGVGFVLLKHVDDELQRCATLVCGNV